VFTGTMRRALFMFMFYTDHEKQLQPIFPERIVLGFGFFVPRRVGFATRENQIGRVPREWPFVLEPTRVQRHVIQYPLVNLWCRKRFWLIFETLRPTVRYRVKQCVCVCVCAFNTTRNELLVQNGEMMKQTYKIL